MRGREDRRGGWGDKRLCQNDLGNMDFYCDRHGSGREVEDGEEELLNPRFACFLYMENGYQIGKRRMNNGLNEMKAKIGSEREQLLKRSSSLLV